jgi:hypothetical protein
MVQTILRAAMNEQVLGVIRVKQLKYWMQTKFEVMFLTEERIIVAPACSGTIPEIVGSNIWLEERHAKPKIDAVNIIYNNSNTTKSVVTF